MKKSNDTELLNFMLRRNYAGQWAEFTNRRDAERAMNLQATRKARSSGRRVGA